MNIDLVERLRATDDIRPDDGYVADLLEEAADEIERLREALRDIDMETREGGQWGLRDVNDYARAALEEPK